MQGSMCLLDLVQLGLLCGEIANLLFFFLPLAIEKQSLLSLLLFFLERPLGIDLVSCSSCTTLLEGSRPNLRVVALLLAVFLIILEAPFSKGVSSPTGFCGCSNCSFELHPPVRSGPISTSHFLDRGSVTLFVSVVYSSDSGAWSGDSEAWSVDAVG